MTQKGSQYELRSEMEEEAFDFINKMQDNGLELSDPYLESYIYGLIAKIAPESLVDGRPCNVNLLIVQQPNPISLIYPNGTIVGSSRISGAWIFRKVLNLQHENCRCNMDVPSRWLERTVRDSPVRTN